MEAMHSGFKPQTRWIRFILCVISGFRREVEEICALMGYYAACSGNLPTENKFLNYVPQRDILPLQWRSLVGLRQGP